MKRNLNKILMLSVKLKKKETGICNNRGNRHNPLPAVFVVVYPMKSEKYKWTQ